MLKSRTQNMQDQSINIFYYDKVTKRKHEKNITKLLNYKLSKT
jgi:hypothetical protein